ncbi:CoA transferase [Sporosarcina sp. ACRSM]|uniref:CaiB/BaiF CoA transferase family protein n=1 Tax=Sporosarcina sp. ACRSM TaxID=2918216 RepID=UPI001EF6BB11|nr:CaiB/BaiF CoA-transferase family protein [Sporosarcina sp. ACRSM]MCG7335847.1 CoA transferase [Sporosarcina sp. ACRSM]
MMKQGALEGVTIVEIGDELTQYAGKLLVDMGAEVIKVEPIEGVPARHVGPFYEDKFDLNGSLYFWHYNTSKKSVTVDMETEEGQQSIRELLGRADVLLEGNKPGEMKGYGLDYEVLSKEYPELIYCSITPFGQTGPWSHYQASDLTQLALGGIMQVTGYDDVPNAPPIAPTGGQRAHIAGYFSAIAIIGALLHRDVKGEGQYIDISAHDCIVVCTEMSIPYWEYQQAHVYRQTGRHALPHASSQWNFKCKDGKHIICLMTYLNGTRWDSLVAWLDSYGMAEDLMDERYKNDNFRATQMTHVNEVLEKFCVTHDSAYIAHTAQSLNLPWAPIRAPEDMLEDLHLVEDRKAFVQVEHPELGKSFIYPGAPYLSNETPWQLLSRAPQLGEHNQEQKQLKEQISML